MRDKNPWVGNACKTSESATFGGRRYYVQVPFFDGKKRGTKKIYYEPNIDGSEKDAELRAGQFITKKKRELGIEQQTNINT